MKIFLAIVLMALIPEQALAHDSRWLWFLFLSLAAGAPLGITLLAATGFFAPFLYPDSQILAQTVKANALMSSLTLLAAFNAPAKYFLRVPIPWLVVLGVVPFVLNQISYDFFVYKNYSMGACFVVMAWALLPFKQRITFLFFPLSVSVFVLWKHDVVTPIAAFFVNVAYSVFRKPLATLFVGFGSLGLLFVNDNGRFILWERMLNFWLEGPWYRIVFGTGLGSTPALIKATKPAAVRFSHSLHNDWLQLLIEGGVLIAIAYVLALVAWFVRLKEDTLAALMCFAAVGFFNFPTHWPLQAALCLILFHRITLK